MTIFNRRKLRLKTQHIAFFWHIAYHIIVKNTIKMPYSVAKKGKIKTN